MILAGLGAGRGVARDPTFYAIREWHVQDGLRSEQVSAVNQDLQGYLWVLADKTAMRFDGMTFLSVASIASADAGATATRIIPARDHDGAVLVIGADGVVAVDPATQRGNVVLPSEPGLQFTAAHAASDGTLWAARSDGALIRRQHDGTEVLRPFGRPATTRPAAFVTGGDGELWLMVGRSLGRLVQGQWQPVPLGNAGDEIRIAASRTGGPWLVANEYLLKLVDGRPEHRVKLPTLIGAHFIRALLEDRNGNLWIGTRSQGLHLVSGDAVTRIPTSHDEILALCQSQDGSLWVGTNGDGLYRLRPRLARLFDKSAGLLDNRSESMCEDRDGTMWFANRDGGVANYRDGRVTVVDPGPRLRRFSAGSVTPAPQGGVWVTSRLGVCHVSGGRPGQTTLVTAVPAMQTSEVCTTARNGDLWLAVENDRIGRLRGEQFFTFGPAEGYYGGRVRSLAEDPGGRIWVGSDDGRLWRTDGDGFTPVPLGLSLPPRAVRAMICDADGTMWLATAGNGLLVRRDGRWHVVNTDHGLADNLITQILRDDRGGMWFGSSRGIFRVGVAELLEQAGKPGAARLHPIMLGRDEDLPNVSCLGSFQPAAWRSQDGRLWFATRSGVLAIDPTVELSSAPPLRVTIDQVRCDGLVRPPSAGMAVDSQVRKLEIQVSVLCLPTPERVRTQYRLDGFDDDWVTAGPERIAAYPRLPPGDYRFRVRASAGAGAVGDRALAWEFTVVPQWWQTVWFRLGALLLAGLAVALAVRAWSVRRLRRQLLLVEKERAIERERTRIAQNIHDDVGASLTRISLLTQSARGEDSDAGARLDQIYRTTTEITRAMDEIVWAVNPKYDDLDGLVYYLGNFAQSFLRLAGIRCRLKVPPTLPSPPLTSQVRHNVFMACKEALHNVVKHSGASEAVLAIEVSDGRLRVSLTDNGRGFDPAMPPSASPHRTAGGQGLHHMRERLTEAGGQCTIQRGPAGGTAVVLELPLAQAT